MDFSWESMQAKLQPNAFGDKKSYKKKEVDTRFWTLSKDENSNGAAIIRFIPDPEGVPFISMEKISANRGKKQFYVSEWSPATIGLPDPFNEKFLELWNAGEKEKAKLLGRSNRFFTNIKVIKDPANPENEGKIFLFDMSKAMIDMLKEVMIETDQMKALGEKPIQVFNPMEGHNFLIKSKMGDNKIVTYANSKFADSPSAIYDSKEEAEKDITENGYKLQEFLEPDFYLSYDELKDLLDKFLKEGKYAKDTKSEEKSEKAKQEPKQEPSKPQSEEINTGLNLSQEPKQEPKQESKSEDADLDDLLADLG